MAYIRIMWNDKSARHSCVPNGFSILEDWGFEDCSKLCKIIIFKYFWQCWSVLSWFWAGPGADHTVFYKNQESVLYSFMPNCFCFRNQLGALLKLLKKWSILSIFGRLGRFPQVYWQVKKSLILDLPEIIRLYYSIACRIVFT